jgi:hypothetical protein
MGEENWPVCDLSEDYRAIEILFSVVCQASIDWCEQETRQGSPYMSCGQLKLDSLLDRMLHTVGTGSCYLLLHCT